MYKNDEYNRKGIVRKENWIYVGKEMNETSKDAFIEKYTEGGSA